MNHVRFDGHILVFPEWIIVLYVIKMGLFFVKLYLKLTIKNDLNVLFFIPFFHIQITHTIIRSNGHRYAVY